MKNFKHLGILLVIMALCLNGCLGAPPVLIRAAAITAGGAHMEAAVVNSAKAQHPNINFDKQFSECVAYDKDYNTVYQACIQGLFDLREQTDRTDKESGIIDTKKTAFGEEPGATGYALGKKAFTQRKLIIVKKISDKKTQVSVNAKFSRKGSYTDEAEFEDPPSENVVRAIFFDKLDQIMGSKSSS